MRVRTVVVLPLVLAAFAPAAAADPAAAPLRTEVVWVDPTTAVAPDALKADTISKTLFVNRCTGGCTITGGAPNDSRSNVSSIVTGTKTISEFSGSDATFDAVIDCLRDVYGPYDIDIVTDDPGTEIFHHEAILAGTPNEIGLNPNIGGIAPAACDPLNNVISFSFGNITPDSVENLCWTVAQESAHSFGLPNHVFDCTDPMTYLGPPDPNYDCGRKYFRNKALPCGEFELSACNCAVSVDGQNSHESLIGTFGPGEAPLPTEVTIIAPTDDAPVNDGFTIFFTASNTRIVDKVELWLNGTKYLEMPGYNYDRRDDDYNFTAPEHPDGYIDVEIKAFDDIGTEGSTTVTVLKGEPCVNAESCFEFQECTAGYCRYPTPVGALGDECPYPQYCAEGECVEHDGGEVCATSCADVSCPDGFECDAQQLCFAVESGGCCSVAGKDRDAPLPYVGLGLFALGLVALRRRRRG
jgi:MYXO-CTERM domain-containing protein